MQFDILTIIGLTAFVAVAVLLVSLCAKNGCNKPA